MSFHNVFRPTQMPEEIFVPETLPETLLHDILEKASGQTGEQPAEQPGDAPQDEAAAEGLRRNADPDEEILVAQPTQEHVSAIDAHAEA